MILVEYPHGADRQRGGLANKNSKNKNNMNDLFLSSEGEERAKRDFVKTLSLFIIFFVFMITLLIFFTLQLSANHKSHMDELTGEYAKRMVELKRAPVMVTIPANEVLGRATTTVPLGTILSEIGELNVQTIIGIREVLGSASSTQE